MSAFERGPAAAKTRPVAVEPLAAAEPWLRLWRALAIDLPLVWAMEVSRFASRHHQELLNHWLKLAGCPDFNAFAAEQSRFASVEATALEGELAALTKEARTVIAAAA